MEYHQLSEEDKELANAVVKDFNNLTPDEQKWFIDHAHAGNHHTIKQELETWAKGRIAQGVVVYFVKLVIRKFPRK